MKKNPFQKITFLKSANFLKDCPEDSGVEFAFVGRSNVGKSSAINLICNSKKLARTSKTPGRTRLINFFAIDEKNRIVDLPGYGFAKVAKNIKYEWEENLTNYFNSRQSLKGVVVLVDSRHPKKEVDLQMIDWAIYRNFNVLILLTKIDKISNSLAIETKRQVAKTTGVSLANIILFSATKQIGLEEVVDYLQNWLLRE